MKSRVIVTDACAKKALLAAELVLGEEKQRLANEKQKQNEARVEQEAERKLTESPAAVRTSGFTSPVTLFKVGAGAEEPCLNTFCASLRK